MKKPDTINGKEIMMIHSKRLLVYGDVEMDILLQTENVQARGDDAKVSNLAFSPGGSAANCAAIAASLGQQVTLLGSLGNDVWRKPLTQDLKRHKVDIRLVSTPPGQSGTCVALVDGSGERKFYSFRGVNESAPPPLPDAVVWKKHQCLHLSGYSFQEPGSAAVARALLHEAHRFGLTVSLDPSYLFAKQQPDDIDDILNKTDLIFPNLEEATMLSGMRDPRDAAQSLLSRGVKTVAVTLGGDGCLVSCASGTESVRIQPTEKVLDSTGAGDAFCGGFLTAWLNGLDPWQSARMGSAAAAYVVTRLGAREHTPTLSDVVQILRANHEGTLADSLAQKFHLQD